MNAVNLLIVAIGRNEGERLVRCLDSVRGTDACIVYVDSGSTDGSVVAATERGAVVVELERDVAFTAARARNRGFARARELHPRAEFVQFVDGDCELAPGWLDTAQAHLKAHADVVAVCGRRRERFPLRSIYNLLCDIEWATPVGVAKSFGGDVMLRAAAFGAVGGYRDDLIAGEEPELCVRLRAQGWRIHRLDAEMTLHDAALLRFSQWWRRSVRTGYAFAQGAQLHGAPPERHWVREVRSARGWTFGVLGVTAGLCALLGAKGLLVLLVYPLQFLRLFVRASGSAKTRLAHAFFLMVGKFAEMRGQLAYWSNRLRRASIRTIEYK